MCAGSGVNAPLTPPWDLIEKERAFGVLFVSTLFIIPIYSEGPASFGSDSELEDVNVLTFGTIFLGC